MKPKNLYGYPEMGRYGLGHSLLAWARCVVWCHKTGAKMVGPRWLRFRIGPYLRGERDKREYFKLFNNKGLIGEPLRGLLMLISDKIQADDGYFKDDIFSNEFLNTSKRNTLLIFNNALADNIRKHFEEVYGHSKLLKNSLTQIVRSQYLPKNVDPQSIAIHVRMGDFQVSSNNNGIQDNNTRQPIDWYSAILQNMRKGLGVDVPAIVYSDGTDDELKLLLAMPNIKRAPQRESITDLLSISEAPALIASGSGFSLWGAFLGQVPTVYYPSRKIVATLDNQELEIESNGLDLLPEVFIETIRKTLKKRSSDVKTGE